MIIAVLTVAHTYGQDERHNRRESMLGLDLTALVAGLDIGLSASHSFHEHWTMEGSVIIRSDILIAEHEEYEKEHYDVLGLYENIIRCSNAFCGDMTVQFWPSHSYRGFYIGSGGRKTVARNVDVVVEAGYCFRLSGKIAASLAYRTGIIETIRSSRLDIKGFRLSINIIL